MALTGVVVAAVLAGCGGGRPEPSAAGWVAVADATCKRTANVIVALGAPQTVPEVRRIAAKASEVVEVEADRIRRVPTPERLRERSSELRAALARVQRRLDTLSHAQGPDAVAAELDKLGPEWQEVDWQGHKAGLKDCADHGLWAIAGERWGAPVFVVQVRGLLKRVGRWQRAAATQLPAPSKRTLLAFLARLRDRADSWDAELGSFDPPGEVLDETQAYQDAFYKLSLAADDMAAAVRRAPIGAARTVPEARRLVRALRREYRARIKLIDALSARPRGITPESAQKS